MGLFFILFIICLMSQLGDREFLLFASVAWILGSITALSLRGRQYGANAKEEHEREFHDRK
ncbi:hypothetical protein [Paenibacillus sp. MBLB4367]|uniref:hypothetical protein n=1 Tax=Paenibacillus sp. MBLB4367 TaxID=3384767 RepID=UPI003907FA7D